MQDLLPLLFVGVVIIGFYLLVIRPAQKRQAEALALLGRLAVGQEVMTTAGIFGTLVAIDEDSVQLAVAPGVELKYAKGAIARILDEEAAAAPVEEPRPRDADADEAGA